MRKWILAVITMVMPLLAQAQIYKCQTGGKITFSDSPCGANAAKITVDPVTVGGRLDTGTDVEMYKPPERTETRDEACPYINSSDLRRLSIQHKIVRGMKPGDVRRSWGSPSSVRTSGGLTQWAFHWPNGNAQYVYFRGGCVTSTSTYKRF